MFPLILGQVGIQVRFNVNPYNGDVHTETQVLSLESANINGLTGHDATQILEWGSANDPARQVVEHDLVVFLPK